jgi:hypothetical protein
MPIRAGPVTVVRQVQARGRRAAAAWEPVRRADAVVAGAAGREAAHLPGLHGGQVATKVLQHYRGRGLGHYRDPAARKSRDQTCAPERPYARSGSVAGRAGLRAARPEPMRAGPAWV